MKRWLVPVLVVLGIAVAAAEGDVEGSFRELLAKLGNDDWTTREQAEKDMIALGSAARTFVEKALETEKDAEVKMRLERVRDALGRARWAGSVRDASREATVSGKPILLVCADGPLDVAGSDAGVALRKTLADKALVEALNNDFVLVWWNAAGDADLPVVPPGGEDRAIEGDTGPVGMIGFYFCSPKGSVRHFLPGWWRAKTLLEEVARVKGCLNASDASEGLKLRRAEMVRIEEAAATMEAQHPDGSAKGEVDRMRRLSAAYRAGEETVGEPLETYLANRMKDLKARRGQPQPQPEER